MDDPKQYKPPMPLAHMLRVQCTGGVWWWWTGEDWSQDAADAAALPYSHAMDIQRGVAEAERGRLLTIQIVSGQFKEPSK